MRYKLASDISNVLALICAGIGLYCSFAVPDHFGPAFGFLIIAAVFHQTTKLLLQAEKEEKEAIERLGEYEFPVDDDHDNWEDTNGRA